MAASFVVGYKKVTNEAEPRFLVLSGDEDGLRRILTRKIADRNDNAYATDFSWVDVADDKFADLLFHGNFRKERKKTYFLFNVDKAVSWDFLPIWFNVAKNIRLVVTDPSRELAFKLLKKANTRGYGIECSAPFSDSSRAEFVKLLGTMYSQSPSQINYLLTENDWQVTECLELLDKMALLNLPLTGDTILRLGVCHDPVREFVSSLEDNNMAKAMTTIERLSDEDYPRIIEQLSLWLTKMMKVKTSQGFMKSPKDIAAELGFRVRETERLVRQSRKYDQNKLNKASLALATADKDITLNRRKGVLEVLVSKW